MELMEAISTNGTCRYYKTDPVPGELVARLLRAAQLGPSGSNRQPVRFLVVREAAKRRGLQALYRPVWEAYLEKARSSDLKLGGQFLTNADHYARHLAEVPVQIVICYGIAEVVPIDAGLDRVSVVGGASIYPMVQNLLLAARAEGLGATLTTLLCGVESEVQALLDIPDGVATAAVIGVGWPAKPFPKQLKRLSLAEISFADSYGTPLPEVQDL
ncbi:MAG TPA: nitroreductase family protein [Gammaproteobacteria bacterium]|jgi:nitroreductase|nr:nitroreductase family protein [Gammaproteobacteria bacterium]